MLRHMLRLCLICLFLAMFSPAQSPQKRDPEAPEDIRLPNGKLQSEAILKDDYERELKDAQQLVELSQSLKTELERSGPSVLSLLAIHKTEEIEKLCRKIRTRVRH